MKPTFTISIDTRRVFDRLMLAEVGAEITYNELTGLTGVNVQKRGRSYLDSARAMAQKQNVVFGVLHNFGLVRLSDTEIVQTGASTVTKIRRTARRGARRIVAVKDFDAMPNDSKLAHNSYASMLGAIAQFSNDGTLKTIQGRVSDAAGGEIGYAKTLALFGGG